MPSPDLVAESNSFKPSTDNRAVSNAFSNEAWDCIDKGGRKQNCSTSDENLVLGGKAGAAASVGALLNKFGTQIEKDLTVAPLDKMGAVVDGTVLDKERQVGNDAKENHKDKQQKVEGKKKDDCLDFNITIEGYPQSESDPRKTQQQTRPDGGHGQGGHKGGSRPPIGREHVPSSSKIDQEYASWLDKIDDKNQ